MQPGANRPLHLSSEKKDSVGFLYLTLFDPSTDYASSSLKSWDGEKVAKPVIIGTENLESKHVGGQLMTIDSAAAIHLI